MSYMKDKNGRRLDTIAVPDAATVVTYDGSNLKLNGSVIPVGSSVVTPAGLTLTDLTNAFTAAVTSGLPCYLPIGTYNVAGAQVTLPANLELHGAGIGQTVIASSIKLASGVRVSDLSVGVAGQSSTIINNGFDGKVERVAFTGGTSGQGVLNLNNSRAERWDFLDCQFHDNVSGGDGVTIVDQGTAAQHYEHIRFVRCWFYNNARMNLEVLQRADVGTVVSGYRHIDALDCRFDAPTGVGGASNTNNVSYDSQYLADGTTISSGYSRFAGNTVTGGHYAVELARSTHMTVENNVVVGGDSRLLSTSSVEHTPVYHRIVNNRFVGSLTANDVVVQGTHNIVTGNHTATPGIFHLLQCDDSLIAFNDIETTGAYALQVENSGDNKIQGNRIAGGTTYSLWLNGSANGEPNGNSVLFNDIVPASAGTDVFIHANVATYTLVGNRTQAFGGTTWAASTKDAGLSGGTVGSTYTDAQARAAIGVAVIPAGASLATANSVLAAGGRVRGIPGTTYDFSSGSLIIPSNTELDLTGCTVTGATAAPYLRNAASVAARTVSDAVTTAGSAVVTSATANFTAADVGRAVQVLAAGPNVGRADAPGSLYGTVLSVDSATQITLSQSATSSTTGKALSVFPARDTNITIVGGTWNGGARTAQSLNGHGFLLRRADNIRVRNATLTSTGSASGGSRYALAYGDVTNAEFSGLTFSSVSDGLHGQGPLSDISIHHIYGTTGDDMVAFTGVDGQSSTASLLGDVEGDMADISVSDIFPNASLRAVKITTGTGTNGVARMMKSVHIARLLGTVQLDAVSITDYAGITTFDGTISDVSSRPSGSGFYPRVKLDMSGGGSVLLRNIRWEDTTHAPSGGIVGITQAQGSVTIEGLSTRNALAGSIGVLISAPVANLSVSGIRNPDAGAAFIPIQYGTLATQAHGRISVRDVYKLATSGDLINVTSAVTAFSFIDLSVSDGYMAAGGVFVQSTDGATALKARISNWRQAGGYLVGARSPIEVNLSNVEFNGSGGAVRANSAAATPVRVRANGVSVTAGSLVTRTATQAVSVHGTDATADITILTPAEGDIVYNTNPSATTGIGRSIYSGTGWDNLETDNASGGGGAAVSIPTALYDCTLSGFTSWAFDPAAAIAASSVSSNVGIYTKQVVAGTTITNVNVPVATAPSGVTDMRGVVYDANGTLLGVTPNMSTDTTAGFKTWALQTPITGLTPGSVIIVAFWQTGGTISLDKTNSNAPVPATYYVGTSRQLTQSNSAYQTSITPGSMSASGTVWWLGTS